MKPPDGTEWKVNWAEDKGEIWLEKGWKEFVEHYSLDQGHFIFFKYEGTSQIHVIILDQSALEIDYPCGNGDENDNLVKTEEESDMVLDEGQDVKDEQIRGKDSLFIATIHVYFFFSVSYGSSEFYVHDI